MKAEIISIGFELLNGRTVNTNATFIAKKLSGMGIQVKWITTIPDEDEYMSDAFNTALSRADIVVSTGGLGPTNDDITKNLVAGLFDSRMILNQKILDRITKRFADRGWKMPEVNREQAMVPEKAKILYNEVGTAPGLLFEKNNKKLFVLPGVPAEMKFLTENGVLPNLNSNDSEKAEVLSFKTSGISESGLFEKIHPLIEEFNGADTMYYPDYGGVELKIVVRDKTPGFSDRIRDSVMREIGKFVISMNADDSLLSVTSRKLLEREETVSVAESCTGGLLGEMFTSLSGSSSYFMGGMITYSNEAKIKLLGVPADIIDNLGAVSEQTAEYMAALVREKLNTTWGIGITGIAGPTGGMEDKPVGMVCIGLSSVDITVVKTFKFGNNREVNRLRAANAALGMLLKKIR